MSPIQAFEYPLDIGFLVEGKDQWGDLIEHGRSVSFARLPKSFRIT
jgi:hypothetical protein